MSVFSRARIIVKNKESLKAIASVFISDAVCVTGIRIVEGKNGLFVSMPQRKLPDGSYQDVAFPASKEIREALSSYLLEQYRNAGPNLEVAAR